MTFVCLEEYSELEVIMDIGLADIQNECVMFSQNGC